MPILNMIYGATGGGGGGWQPGANTLVYLPLDGDALDQSGNSRDGTLPGSTYYSWEYISGNSGTQYYLAHGGANQLSAISGSYGSTALGSTDRTICVWIKFNVLGSQTNQVAVHYIGTANGGTQGEWFGLYGMDGKSGQIGILRYYGDPSTTNFTYDTNWHLFTITYNDTTKAKLYCDGQQVTMTSNANSSFNTIGTNYYLGALISSDTSKRIGLSKYIIEDKERTAQEIADYYNLTKGDYGIS